MCCSGRHTAGPANGVVYGRSAFSAPFLHPSLRPFVGTIARIVRLLVVGRRGWRSEAFVVRSCGGLRSFGCVGVGRGWCG